MNVLVTAGNTQTPIDKVRCITNVFTGRTGGTIAAHAFDRGHRVTILTSHPEVLSAISSVRPRQGAEWEVRTYRTFDDLEWLMGAAIPTGGYDAIIHGAAVSDYKLAGLFADSATPLVDTQDGKIQGAHPELWLKLVPTPKLVDKIRTVWGFNGVLVKFKLEVGLSESVLEFIAEKARIHSDADLLVANTLEGMHDWALIGNAEGYARHSRSELASVLLEMVNRLVEKRSPKGL